MVNNDEYIYVPFSEDKLNDLFFLFSLENNQVSKKYLFNKFSHTIYDYYPNFLGYIAYNTEGNPVAFIGGFPAKFHKGNRFYEGVQIGDVITHPSHRRKGLFVSIASRFFDFLEELESFDLVFGLPNDNLAPAYFNKLHWKNNGLIQSYSLHKTRLNIYGICHKFKFLTPFYHFYKNVVLKLHQVNKLKIIENNSSSFVLIKDMNLFNYKKKYLNATLISISNNYYYIKFIDGIQIDFILINEESKVQKDLSYLSFIFGVNKFTTMQTENSSYLSSLINIGFIKANYSLNTGYLFLKDKSISENFALSISDADEF